MDKKVKILNISVVLILIILSILYCLNIYLNYTKQQNTLHDREQKSLELQSKLEDLVSEYDKQITSIYKSEKDIDLVRKDNDIKFLNKYVKPCFEFVDSTEYTRNRDKLLKVAPLDSNIFTDYLVANDSSLGGNNIDVSGLKMECEDFKVFVSPNEKYCYYVILDYLPFIGNDNVKKEYLNKQRLIMVVKMNANGKKIDSLDCYKSDTYI